MNNRRRALMSGAILAVAAGLLPVTVLAQGKASSHELTVKVFADGSFSGGSADWISGARVQFLDDRGGRRDAVTNRKGEAKFSQMKAGQRYTLSISAKGRTTVQRVHLQAGYDQRVFIALKPIREPEGHSLRVRAFVHGTWEDGDADWISQAHVLITRTGTGEIVGNRITNSQGAAHFFNLPPGNYRVSINKAGWSPRVREITMGNQNHSLSLAMVRL